MKKHISTILLAIFFVLSAIAHYAGFPPVLQFIFSAIAVILVAGFLGRATESVAHYAGQRLGGFLNATFGNAAELIIAIMLLREGLYDMVKASLTGSIIGNLLLVLGLSIFAGGVKHKVQNFNVALANMNGSLMIVAVIALFVPALFLNTHSITHPQANTLSLIVAGILILAYIAWLIFSMVTHKNYLGDVKTVSVGGDVHGAVAVDNAERPAVAASTASASGMDATMTGAPPSSVHANVAETHEEEEPAWTKGRSILYLLIATVMTAFVSEWLVGTLETFTSSFGFSELFVGAFVVAIIGNAAEHSAAILLAMKNKIGASVEIAVGSSLQIALFVAPVLVFVSFFLGNTMDIVFTTLELVAIMVSVFIAKSIIQDGSTNWYEGLLLIVVYIILGVSFYMV